MALRQCDNCGETVDEAKAFCPGCGNAFVEEERRDASKFDELGHTVQFGQTMYNQMLEDMGLSTSATPNPVQERVEVIEPIKTAEPLASSAAKRATAQTASKPSNLKWYILCGVAAIVLLPIAIGSVIMILLEIWSRLR